MQTVSVQELQKVLQQKNPSAIVLDVRTPAEYAAERIAQTYNVPLQDIEEHVEPLQGYDTVYVYCQSGRRSHEAMLRLGAYGVNVYNVEGGISEWKANNLPVVRSQKVLPMMQQVLIGAGSLVGIGTLGVVFVSEWFLLLLGFVSLGLLFAGITGHCMMAYLLAYMPWNAQARMTLPWEKSKQVCSI